MNIAEFSTYAEFDGHANMARLQKEPTDIASFIYGTKALPRMIVIASEFLAENYPQFNMAEIIGDSRVADLVMARHHVWYEVKRQRPDVSNSELGRRFRRDHSTILVGIKKHKERMGIK